jgi:hypothetical protein
MLLTLKLLHLLSRTHGARGTCPAGQHSGVVFKKRERERERVVFKKREREREGGV